MNINTINPNKIVQDCSDTHIENVITMLVEKARIADKLCNEVLALNAKCGELGEGKCLTMQGIAEQFKEGLDRV